MARWRSLPDELDPPVREFVQRLRVLVDHAGLGAASVADRTGYSRASWERYLGGRLLAPKGAVVALAEVTGTPHQHLAALWEPAERAWSRSEARHEMTMEAIRDSRARAAPVDAGLPPRPPAARPAADGPAPPVAVGPGGEAGGSDPQPPVPAPHGAAPRAGDATVPRWRPRASAPGPGAGSTDGATAAGARRMPLGAGRRKGLLAVGTLAGALLLVAGVALSYSRGDGAGTGPSAAGVPRPVITAPPPASGAGCTAAGCTGRDPEAMGCGGRSAFTVASAPVGGGLVEVRYSRVCRAAWARITKASPGDTVRIAAGRSRQDGTVGAEATAHTPMVAVREVSEAEACATLVSGVTGCTAPE
ncbi:DUF2690 domain-containing protein [Streptomyces sp. NPDC051840]|uniref:helix-turn-helix domain-containing protein n=1 Tax=Streptomyces sp. NPDC051840 TaxID=3154752 RepID=UPI003443A550